MTDEQLVQFVSEFRNGILGDDGSDCMCYAICWPLESLLNLHGVDCELVESDLGWINHYWLRLTDGRALDPTADQFGRPETVYIGPPTDIHP